jgi:ubiquinone/menaquinone biosynthesis C-methylase UbiE
LVGKSKVNREKTLELYDDKRQQEIVRLEWDYQWRKELNTRKDTKKEKVLLHFLKQKLNPQKGLSPLNKVALGILKAEIKDFKGKKVIEVGSGPGSISCVLASHGAEITLLDISLNALKLAQSIFKNSEEQPKLICGSAFQLPFQDNCFDVVWNAGVLEHFTHINQKEILDEMHRICKVNGNVITLNPYAKAWIYRLGKWVLEKKGMLACKYEVPISTLKWYFKTLPQAYLVKEYSMGMIVQLHFLRVLFTFNQYLASGCSLLIRVLNKLFGFMDRFPGYWLITVSKKQPNMTN